MEAQHPHTCPSATTASATTASATTTTHASARRVAERIPVNGGAKRDHLGGVRRDRLAAAGLSP